MPKTKTPRKTREKHRYSNADWNGQVDGSPDRWMTRRKTDKGENIQKDIVPESSHPSEANDFHESFDRKKWNKKVQHPGYNSQVTPGKWITKSK